MDDAYNYNRERWEALVKAGALFTRPWLDLDEYSARERLYLEDVVTDVAGKRVLCLASGGGQQSAAFAFLGADVAVLDISSGQLAQDQAAAKHYGFQVETAQGDMRDLSTFESHSFDIVWHPYSLNFVPRAVDVFREVARVLRNGGIYHFMAANPFASGIGSGDWNGDGYSLRQFYLDGAELTYEDEDWVFRGEQPQQKIQGPREYRQTLSSLLNGLVNCGFVLLKTEEWGINDMDLDAEPGSWDHLTAVMPPWIKYWTVYRPDVFGIIE
jgi:SAM-dependent methyltransferase